MQVSEEVVPVRAMVELNDIQNTMEIGGKAYELDAVVEYQRKGGGHYVVHCKGSSQWYEFDDLKPNAEPSSLLNSVIPHLLIYSIRL